MKTTESLLTALANLHPATPIGRGVVKEAAIALAEYQALETSHAELLGICEDFVAKVHRGEARSVHTVARMESAIQNNKKRIKKERRARE